MLGFDEILGFWRTTLSDWRVTALGNWLLGTLDTRDQLMAAKVNILCKDIPRFQCLVSLESSTD